jgi:molybdopterin synthase sulfur carrier subunit
MAVRMLYFARVREAIGVGEELVDPPASVTSVADLVAWLAGRGEGHAAAFADPGRLRAAIDQAMVPLDAPLGSPKEVALFPPVTGG